MNVRLEILFKSPTADDRGALRSVARKLTSDRKGVRVYAKEDAPGWLVAEFTMPTEAQYKAVDRIDRVLRLELDNRMDSIISFPKEPDAEGKRRKKA